VQEWAKRPHHRPEAHGSCANGAFDPRAPRRFTARICEGFPGSRTYAKLKLPEGRLFSVGCGGRPGRGTGRGRGERIERGYVERPRADCLDRSLKVFGFELRSGIDAPAAPVAGITSVRPLLSPAAAKLLPLCPGSRRVNEAGPAIRTTRHAAGLYRISLRRRNWTVEEPLLLPLSANSLLTHTGPARSRPAGPTKHRNLICTLVAGSAHETRALTCSELGGFREPRQAAVSPECFEAGR
jgi:hypothetical protein